MVDIAAIETFDHEVAREAEILAHFYRLLVQYLTRKILRYAAVVYVTKLVPVVLVVEQVIHVHVVYIAWDVLQVEAIFVLDFATLTALDHVAVLWCAAVFLFLLELIATQTCRGADFCLLAFFVLGVWRHFISLF